MKIDHHTYLAAGDLRTAEDALEWLTCQRLRALDNLRDRYRSVAAEHRPYGEAVDEITYALQRGLQDRLDRERRQACRRGALEMWREYVSLVLIARLHGEALDPLGEPNCVLHLDVRNALSAALAFRAAARAR